MTTKVHGTPEELNNLDREEGWHPEVSGQEAVKGNKNKKSVERYEKSANAAKEGDVQVLIKQIQEEETPSKKQARDKNILYDSWNPEADGTRIESHLFNYNIDFPKFMKNIAYILKQNPEQQVGRKLDERPIQQGNK
jgi:hypothetical protein